MSVCFLLHSLTNSYGQSRKNLRDSSTIIIFNQSTTSTYKKKKTGEDNVVKIAPLGFVSGTFPILYERRITDFFSVQASAGITNKNYSRSLIQGTDGNGNNVKMQYPWSDSRTDLSANIYDFTDRTPKMGYMFSIQPRLYFESEGLDGSFMGISYNYYRYNFSIPGITGGMSSYKQNGAPKDEHENITDLMVHFGHQELYDRLSVEWSTDLGIRNVKGEKYAAGYGSSSSDFIEGSATYKQTVFNFNIGLKVGYHF